MTAPNFIKGQLVRPINDTVEGYRRLSAAERDAWYEVHGHQLDSAGETMLAPRYKVLDLQVDRIYTVTVARASWSRMGTCSRSSTKGCMILCSHTGEEMWVAKKGLEAAE